MIVYIENSKEYTIKVILEVINEFNKVRRYKIGT